MVNDCALPEGFPSFVENGADQSELLRPSALLPS